ncbi:MAG: gliding motility-associated C-terminal domain-containing protein, partial [Bacteroidota bacterium]
EEGKYSVVLINGACTSDPADSIMVNVHPLPEKPVISPSGPVNLVRGESVTLTSSEADSYLWSTSATSREIEISEEGQYTVKVFNSQGCESELSDPVEVTVTEFLPAPEIIVEGDTSFCEGGSVKLISEEAHAYRWSNGQTTREISLTESGTYSVVIENSKGVESYPSEAVKVEVFSLPSADANITDVSCFNGSDGTISLTITNGELPYTVEWNGGLEGTSIDGLEAGTYDATITDANGCQTTVSPVVDQPSEIIVGGDVENARCPDASDGEIRLSVSGGTSPYIYNWDEGMTGSVLTNVPAGTYNVTVVDAHNCRKSGSFAVENKEEYCFRVPDIITPNGDGKNDSWQISGLELYPQVVVQIYDRWGKRVFYSEGYDNNFDGTYNGDELPMESYHYVINLNDGSPVIIGNITIIR